MHHSASLSQSLTMASFFHRPLQPWTQHRTLTSLWTVMSRCRPSTHISYVCRSAYCFLRQLYVRSCDRCRLIWPRQVVHTFISLIAFRLLQSLFYMAFLTSCSGAYRLHRMLQHSMVTGTRRCDHITQVLQQLHWLPVRQQVEFKLAVLRSTTWHHHICQMTASSLSPPAGRRQLRSSDSFKCTIMQLYQFTS